MARNMEPRFKKSRRLGLNVTGHPKAMNKAHNGQARDSKRLSPYGVQLLEKQRLRAYYEVLEKQFRRYVKKAMKSKQLTGQALVKSLECRLDNIVYRMNFASTLRQARQMVTHGHIRVNDQKINLPSYPLQPGDTISLKPRSQNIAIFKQNFTENIGFQLPYITKESTPFTATLTREPNRNEIPIQIQDHLVVEFYSRII